MRADRSAVLEGLAPALRDAGYTTEALQRAVRAASPDDVGVLNHGPALERVRGDRSTAATLLRLFFLEAPERYRDVAKALSRARCDQLLRAGLLRRRGDRVEARLRIDAVGTQYFIADRRFGSLDRSAMGLPGRDPVYPPSSDSLLLRDAVVAAAGARALDLCTGSGIQAMQQAPHAAAVVAVDLSPRAAAVAAHNARLNAVHHVDVRVGDLYAPVRGERFDLIIANPPFVSSPYRNAPGYHAGGPRGDRVLRRIVAGLARHLQPGGRAFAVSHLALPRRDDMEGVARAWFRNFDGRALVLVLETGTPVDLAAAQALFALERGVAAYAAEVRRWVAYLRAHRIETVAAILVVAERRGRRGVEVVEAQARVLPIPLTPPPAERIRTWLGRA